MNEHARCASCREPVQMLTDPLTGMLYECCGCGTRRTPRLVATRGTVAMCTRCRAVQERLAAVVNAVAALGNPTASEVGEHLNWPTTSCYTWLHRARRAGLLVHQPGKGGRWRVA